LEKLLAEAVDIETAKLQACCAEAIATHIPTTARGARKRAPPPAAEVPGNSTADHAGSGDDKGRRKRLRKQMESLMVSALRELAILWELATPADIRVERKPQLKQRLAERIESASLIDTLEVDLARFLVPTVGAVTPPASNT
jgi:hypothetical protein